VIPALVPTCADIVGHRNIGASTGFMHSDYGQWPELAAAAAGISTAAAELSALSEPELPALVDFLLEGPPLPFLYVSVHAPTKARQWPEDDLVDMLLRLTQRVDAIVMHPDAMDEPSRPGTRPR
jgi:hypothetical protein